MRHLHHLPAALLLMALAACGTTQPQVPVAQLMALPTAVIAADAPSNTRPAQVPAALEAPPALHAGHMAPSATPVPPTATPVPPSATPIPPSATPVPPSATPVPPTAAPAAPPPVAQADPRPARIVIEPIGMDRPLVSVGLDAASYPVVPDHDAAWYNLSARPGDGENVVVWGHALRFQRTPNRPAPMERMKELAIGTPITLIAADGSAHRYTIAEQVWATPNQVHYILPRGREMLTVVNCIGDIVINNGEVDMTHRLITIAYPAP